MQLFHGPTLHFCEDVLLLYVTGKLGHLIANNCAIMSYFFFLKGFSSLAFSYCRRFFFFLFEEIFLPLLLIEKMFFVCSLIFFWSVWSCSSHTSTSLGSSFSFLLFCLDTNFRTWFSFFTTKFTNFFMTEEGGSYNQGI